METQESFFIPAKAIMVPKTRTLKPKKNRDFGKMKNLFLANCLKIKTGEEGLSQRMEKAMSNRIKANRGGELTPLKPRGKKFMTGSASPF